MRREDPGRPCERGAPISAIGCYDQTIDFCTRFGTNRTDHVTSAFNATMTSTPGSSSSAGYTLSIIGCGTMGVAILSGILDSQRAQATGALAEDKGLSASQVLAGAGGSTDPDLTQLPSRYYACVSRQESGRRLEQTFPPSEHGNLTILVQNNLEAFKRGDVVVLGCKPNLVKDILGEDGVREALKGKLLVSICAGLRIETMRGWVDESTKVVRAMPNTPSKVRRSRRERETK